MKRSVTCFTLLFFIFNSHIFFSQKSSFYRFKADYTVKEIDTASVQKISMGKVFFDKSVKKLHFQQQFPNKNEMILTDDDLIVNQKDGKKNEIKVKGLLDFTIYSLLLNGQLQDFGLSTYGFKLEKVETVDGIVLMTYLPPKNIQHKGKIELGKKDGRLDVIVMYKENGDLISRTFYKDYILIQGLAVPQRVVQIAETDSKKVSKKISTFKNIKLNEQGYENLYNP